MVLSGQTACAHTLYESKDQFLTCYFSQQLEGLVHRCNTTGSYS